MPYAKPKHQVIFETLRDQIASGRHSPQRRFPSEMELAHRFKVSRPTAARALRDLQAMGLVSRRAGSGTFLRTIPSRGTPSITLGLLVEGLGNTEIMDPICSEISRFAERLNMSVLHGHASTAGALLDDVESTCRGYIQRKVAGVFYAPLETISDRQAVNLRIVQSLRDAGIAIVLLDRDILEYPHRSDLDLVGIDNFHAGMILTEHLLRLGHRSFTFVARPQFPSTTDLRLAGCRQALACAGLDARSIKMRPGHPDDAQFVRGVMSPKSPDAIICSNDRTAALLIQTLSGMKIDVPRDVAVVGIDDVRYATLLSVPLTTIHQPCRAIGEIAVQAMQSRLENPALPPRQILLPAELVVRKSCGAPSR